MVNDISIIGGIVSVFILVGICLPFVHQSFAITSAAEIGTDEFEEEISSEAEEIDNPSGISPFKIFFSVLRMFFWTFGDLPFWLDGIFIIFRVILVLTIARNVWIGGGA